MSNEQKPGQAITDGLKTFSRCVSARQRTAARARTTKMRPPGKHQHPLCCLALMCPHLIPAGNSFLRGTRGVPGKPKLHNTAHSRAAGVGGQQDNAANQALSASAAEDSAGDSSSQYLQYTPLPSVGDSSHGGASPPPGREQVCRTPVRGICVCAFAVCWLAQ